MALAQVVILNTATTVLTAPSELASLAILFCNTSTTDEAITINIVKSGDSVGVINRVVDSIVIPSKNTWEFNTKVILDAGDFVVVKGTVGSLVSATCSYKVM